MVKPESIKAGYVVSVELIPGTAPYSYYIGLVKATNKYGIRINPAKWDDNFEGVRLSTEDFYIPWININSMLVCTD